MKVAVVPYGRRPREETWYVLFVKDEEAWRRLKIVAKRVKRFKRRSTLERYGHMEYFFHIMPCHPPVELPLFFESVEAFREWLEEKAREEFKTEEARRHVLERLEAKVKMAERRPPPPPIKRYRVLKYKAFDWLPRSYVAIARRGKLLARSVDNYNYTKVKIFEFKPSYMVWVQHYYDTNAFLFLKKDADVAEAVEELAEMEEDEFRGALKVLELALRLLKDEEEGELAELREKFAMLASAAKLLLS